MITKCGVCEDYRAPAAAFQNERHGAGMRVCNPMAGKNKGKYRCTVCGGEKAPAGVPETKKGKGTP